MNEPNTIFPWREVLSGSIRGKSEAEIFDLCGRPHEVEDDLRIYRFGRDVSSGMISDPRSVVIQFWITDGVADHAALQLTFADNLRWDEVLW